MLTPFRRPTALALAVGLAAGACAPQASATPTLTPSQTAAPTAAVTGTPSPTPTATAACPERVLDVVPPGTDAQNEPIGVLKRGYGHDPTTVSTHGMAFLRGMAAAGITTTAKHFPGLGRVKGNTDFTAAVVDDSTTIDDAYLAPFRDAVAAGIPFVMVALATYQRIDPNDLAVFSTPVMRLMLRDSLNFTGAVVSDDLGATAAVANLPPANRAINFL